MSSTQQPTIRVLVVEDDVRVARIVREFVARVGGFAVVGVAATAAEALHLLARTDPHLVILDVYLPDELGTDLLLRLRSSGQPVDVMLITAARETHVLQAVLRAGVVDYLVKPFKFERLRAALSTYRRYHQQLGARSEVEQSDVDRILQTLHRGRIVLPEKGIDPLTLERLRDLVRGLGRPMPADQLARRAGVSRTTARRYLEYLVCQGEVAVELVYGSVGRPERNYRPAARTKVQGGI